MQQDPTVDEQQVSRKSEVPEGASVRRRSTRRRGWTRRNARRVPTAQRVRTFFRFCRWMFRWGIWLVGLPVLFLSSRMLWDYFSHDSLFALRKVSHFRHHDITTQELLRAGGIRYGENLMLLDLKEVARRMKRHPQIRWVRLRRDLPDTLTVELRTHRPVALLVLDQVYLMSASGVPYKLASQSQRRWKMLRIRGIQKGEYVAHPKMYQRIFRHALALKEVYRQKRMSRYSQLREIRIDRVVGYVLKTKQTTIHLGYDRLPERLSALMKVYKLFGKRGMQKIRAVYLNLEQHLRRAVIKPYRNHPVARGPAARKRKQVVAIR